MRRVGEHLAKLKDVIDTRRKIYASGILVVISCRVSMVSHERAHATPRVCRNHDEKGIHANSVVKKYKHVDGAH